MNSPDHRQRKATFIPLTYLASAVLLLALGGCNDKPKSEGPLQAGWFYPCADGTVYVETDDGQLFWVIKDKATRVACKDEFPDTPSPFSDAKGGLYVQGKKHLWYVKGGKATQVTKVQASELAGEHPQVTRDTLIWALLKEYGETGHDAGYDAALDE